MANIAHIENARTLQFSSLTYRLDAPGLGRSTRTIAGFCVTKGAGLAFDIPASVLGLPISASFHFRGTVVDADNIDWTVDDALDEWAGIVHVTRAHGTLRTHVTDLDPRLSPACDGSQQVARVQMEIVSGSLVVDTSLGSATIDQVSPGPVLATEILTTLHFETSMYADQWSADGCGMRFQLQGNTAVFHTVVSNLQVVGTLTRISYEWQVPAGVTVIGSTSDSHVTLRFDQTGMTTVRCNVFVETSLGTASRSTASTFAVITNEEAQLRSFFCRLRSVSLRPALVIRGIGAPKEIGGIRIVDPLWDPVPDGLAQRPASTLARPFRAAELARLEKTIGTLAVEIEKVAAQARHLRAHAEKLEHGERELDRASGKKL